MSDAAEYRDNVVPLTDRLSDRGGAGLEPPGGGNGGSGMWQAGIDRQIGELRGEISDLRRDQKWLLGVLATAFLILAGGGWTCYAKLSDQIQSVSQAQAVSSGDVKAMDARLNGRLDLMLSKLDERPDSKHVIKSN